MGQGPLSLLQHWSSMGFQQEEQEEASASQHAAQQEQRVRCAASGCTALHERLCRCREWADIAAELHRRNQFWVMADIIAELVPMGRAAVEAQKAIYDCYGAQLVRHSPSITQVHGRSVPARVWGGVWLPMKGRREGDKTQEML